MDEGAGVVAAGVAAGAAVVAAIVAVVAAAFAYLQLRESSRATQLQVFDATFTKLRALEDDFYTKNPKSDSAAERQWCSGFFNTLEYMCFLVNEGFIPPKPFISFYRDAIIQWYDNIFIKKADDEQQDDPQRFPELKKLYKQINR